MAASVFLSRPFTVNSINSTSLALFHVHGHKYSSRKPRVFACTSNSQKQQGSSVSIALDEATTTTRSVPEVAQEKPATTIFNLTVTVKLKEAGNLIERIRRSVEAAIGSDKGGIVLQLVSTELDLQMKSKLSREVVLDWPKRGEVEVEAGLHTYKVDVQVDPGFGVPGAILVSNRYEEEFFLQSASAAGIGHFACRSWIQPAMPGHETRIFFCDKPYLPSQTPAGLIELRKRELKALQGDGKGLRLPSDRIYDYDVYNDLGNPDKGNDNVRPTLGGENYPYPRRCRTGRPRTSTDTQAEVPPSAALPAYVPRDEEYEEEKQEFMSRGTIKVVLRNIIPVLITIIFGEKNFYLAVDAENHGHQAIKTKIASLDEFVNGNPFVKILSGAQETIERVLKLQPPKYISKDLMWGLPDDEFGRRVLASVNPVNIEKLKAYPPVSKLDPCVYGSLESALTENHIISSLGGMSVQQAIDEDKLFILDYHDPFLPYVERINALKGRKAYATRTIFFLTPLGTLKPIAIELSLPSTEKTASSKVVLTPPNNGTSKCCLWELGKEHACSNDAVVHQLVNHWLRIHACMEPFFIAAHRNLSVMHPVFKLLHPHMRYLLRTNAFTRENLIGAGGIVETFNAPAQYCMQFSSSAYQDWQFNEEGLPADLLRRGMAEPDSTSPHGLRLTVEDYPYAQDGLLIWYAIKNLVAKHVSHFYPEARLVQGDAELQAWYSESVKTGHADLCIAPWWPDLSTPEDLIDILTTIIWKVTGQHAVHNFGQYPYAGYIPARPPYMTRLLPLEDHDPDYKLFLDNPREYFLSSIPSLSQATEYAGVLDSGSSHSPDEEYIGERKELSCWAGNPEILEAFTQFSLDIKSIEQEITKRNSDPNLRNRCGGSAFPFELLIPTSESGTTSRGVPNSVTA